ncbi:NUDIX domain-containing protein [Salibaculum sp.]|uniref:NUDIX domain-containing protein n=1 Tax=Salibaculum sp. TaxID=2855480 RepID=UPI002B48FFD8|nr:NUDIX domain-containing protein [Salibaculum sp.]HKL68937.1 NUDIX domain-containing protein [Salibaculum sp.]
MTRPVRLAVRGLLMQGDKLLLVNAYPGRGDLWCAPGGGVDPHQSLPENLAREIYEETGLTVGVNAPCLVNEFHDPQGSFHQVDIYFHCTLVSGALSGDWQDPEQVVSLRRWVSRSELAGLRVKPDSLAAVAWGDPGAPSYDPLEPILR